MLALAQSIAIGGRRGSKCRWGPEFSHWFSFLFKEMLFFRKIRASLPELQAIWLNVVVFCCVTFVMLSISAGFFAHFLDIFVGKEYFDHLRTGNFVWRVDSQERLKRYIEKVAVKEAIVFVPGTEELCPREKTVSLWYYILAVDIHTYGSFLTQVFPEKFIGAWKNNERKQLKWQEFNKVNDKPSNMIFYKKSIFS